ncbi:MAG TPA: hypothetical protein VNW54_03955 [Granulicella sp.]|jgi:hypothetical protein|nr:hypothetical protein [Granulicella sp.]
MPGAPNEKTGREAGFIDQTPGTTGGVDDDDGDGALQRWQAQPSRPELQPREPQAEDDEFSLGNLPKPALNTADSSLQLTSSTRPRKQKFSSIPPCLQLDSHFCRKPHRLRQG